MKKIFRFSPVVFVILLIICTNSCKKDKPTAPVLTTAAVSAISQTMATSGGNITNEGGASIISMGVCWHTSPTPTISHKKTSLTGGSGLFNSNITALTPNTLYYVRAYATNSAGTGYGNQVSFTSSQILIPSLTTTSISSITQTSAVSGGNISSDNGGLVTERGVCWGTTTNPTTLNNITSDGTGTGSFTSNITGLTAGTTYYVRAYSTNSAGTAYGNENIFTTSQGVLSPTVTTNAASAVTQTEATLNGTVNANNQSTTVTFEYGTTTSYGQNINATTNTVTGSTSTNVSVSLTGLSSNTLYHFRIKAVSSGGTTFGSDVTFTTTAGTTAPTATTTAATIITQSGATLNGTVNANNQSTTVTFEYGTTTSYGQNINATPNTATGTSITTVNASVTGLSSNTLYHFRVKAVSTGGTTLGSDLTFTTSSGSIPPTATTIAATAITQTGTTLNGIVNANNQSTIVTFEYGITTSYGQSLNATPGTVTGSINTNVSTSLTGLTANTAYHFRVKAVSSGGITYGSDLLFTTLVQGSSFSTFSFTAEVVAYTTPHSEVSSYLDKYNNTHIAWIKTIGTNQSLMYSVYNNLTVSTVEIPTPSITAVKFGLSLVLDANNHPHITYFVKRDANSGITTGNYAVMYAGDPSGNGTFEVSQVSTNPASSGSNTDNIYNCYVNGRPNIAMDGNNILIAYYSDSNPLNSYHNWIIFAVKSGSTWNRTQEYDITKYGVTSPLEISLPYRMTPNYHNAWLDISNYNPRFNVKNGSSWSNVVISQYSGYTNIYNTQIDYDDNNNIHLMWFSNNLSKFCHTIVSGSSVGAIEELEIIDKKLTTSNFHPATVDIKTGKLYMSYQRYTTSNIFIMSKDINNSIIEKEIPSIGTYYGNRSLNVYNGFVSLVTASPSASKIYITTGSISK